MNPGRRLWTSTLSVLGMLLSTAGTLHAASPSGPVERYEARTYSNIRYPALEQIPDESPVADAVDDRPLWRLLRDKQYVELRAELERYRHWYPAWQAPVDLVTGLALGELSAGVKSRTDKRAWQQVIALAEQHPEEFSCSKIHNRWALGEAYFATGQAAALRTLYERILAECPEPEHRLVSLQQAGQRLPYAVTANFLTQEQQKSLAPDARAALADVEYRFYAGWLANAVQRNAGQEADRAADYVQSGVNVRRDVGTASLLGWWALRRGRDRTAIDWFTRALNWRHDKNLAYGLASAWLHARRLDQVRILADNWRDEPRIARLLSNPGPSPIVLAYRRGHYRSSLRLAETALKKLGPKPTRQRQSLRLLRAWSLLRLGAVSKAADQFTAIYKENPGWESAKGLVLSSERLGEDERPQALAHQRGGPLSVLLQPLAPAGGAGANIYYDYYRNALARALRAKASPKSRVNVSRLARRIVARRDAPTALLAGWAYFKSGDNATAERWFANALAWHPSVEAAQGLALTRRAAGDWEGAERVAKQWGQRYPTAKAIGGEALLDRGDKAYASKNYHESLSYAHRAHALGAGRRASMLSAWSHYGLGDSRAAASEFASLYRAEPDDESANGWLTAALANQNEQALRAEAAADSPLNRRLRDHDADDYFGRDLFLLANTTRVSAHPELAHADSASLAWLPFARHRSGISGLSHLDMRGVSTQLRWGWGLHRFGIDVDWLNLDAGALLPGAQVGSLGSPRFSTTTTASSLVAPQFTYLYAGEMSPYIILGSTPLGGAVDGVAVGSIGLRNSTKRQFWDVSLFAQNIQQSILSISGLIDPTTGKAWGRAVERGGQARLWHALNERWSVTAAGTLSQIAGHELADNLHTAARIGLGYALPLPGFDYFTLGPAYGFEHYSDNRRFFTYGHGGYFSPEQFHKAGVELNFQTTDGRPFIVRAHTAVSYQYTNEADAPAFPLTNSGPLLSGGATNGAAFDANVAGIYQLSPHTQLGGFFDLVQSPNFTDIGGGVLIRILFEPRAAAVSTDLPNRPYLP